MLDFGIVRTGPAMGGDGFALGRSPSPCGGLGKGRHVGSFFLVWDS